MSGGAGTFAVHVWPTHVALAKTAEEVVPSAERAQITWVTDAGGTPIGFGEPESPAGEYQYVHYFQAPFGPPSLVARMDQYVIHHGGVRRVGPIFVDGDMVVAQV